jgi:protein translocase SecG subunit
MLILQYVLLAIEVVVSLLLILLILAQKTRAEGLGLAFGSGMGEALFGSRAGNILTKLTITFAIVFLVNTLFLSMLYTGARRQSLMGRYTPAPPPAPSAPVAPVAPPAGSPAP